MATAVRALYRHVRREEGRLGGGEGTVGIYGSITEASMGKVVQAWERHCGLDREAVMVDVGSGLGRPLLHALASHGIAKAVGIEVDAVKVAKARALVENVGKALSGGGDNATCALRAENAAAPLAGRVEFHCRDIVTMDTLGDATHCYSFWEGVPPDAKEAFGRLVRRSATVRGVVVVQRGVRGADDAPQAMMQEYDFGSLTLVSSFAVAMAGSGRKMTAYVFGREPAQSAILQPRAFGVAAADVEAEAEDGFALPTETPKASATVMGLNTPRAMPARDATSRKRRRLAL